MRNNLGETVLAGVLLLGAGVVVADGFSKATSASVVVTFSTAQPAVPALLPEIAVDATGAVAYNASGEGVFMANGDLVGGASGGLSVELRRGPACPRVGQAVCDALHNKQAP